MTKKHIFPYDQDYVVDGISPSIKAKITKLIDASMYYAFIRASEPADREAIEHRLHKTRCDLERTILTLVKKAQGNHVNKTAGD